MMVYTLTAISIAFNSGWMSEIEQYKSRDLCRARMESLAKEKVMFFNSKMTEWTQDRISLTQGDYLHWEIRCSGAWLEED